MPPAIKIIHLTDLHLKKPPGTVLGIDPSERLATVIRSVNDNHADAALCVVTGDIADMAEPEAYRLAREMLSALSVPLALTLGNHDARTPFRQAFPTIATSEGGFIQDAIDLGPVAVVIVDTLDEDHPGQGLVCGARLAWLDRQLEVLAPKPVIVFMHHPPLSIGLAWFEPMLIANGSEVMAVLRRHENVLHLAFGHAHVNTSGTWQGLSFSGSRGTCHKILAHPARQTAEYVDQGAAYDLMIFSGNGLSVHSIDPAGPNRLIGREFATADEKGEFENLRNDRVESWM